MYSSNDILEHLYKKYPFDENNLTRLVCGSKHCGVELKNGNIGICSTLGVAINGDKNILANPDFTRIEHRIMVNAWVNACANYALPAKGEGDVFDAIDFTRYRNIVMIGYFCSLSAKFQKAGIPLTIFDLDPIDKPVAPIETQQLHLAKADVVILTATTISNMTFTELMGNVSHAADVLVLGPSTNLDSDLLHYPKVKALFGSRFAPFDSASLDLIEKGECTKKIMPFIKKVYLYR
jgi:uncharacterized protein (DUF4213/DUF364 family)